METFELNGRTFHVGDKLIISAPELGTIEVIGTLAGFSSDKSFNLTFGLVKTPLPCRSSMHRDDVNARMSLTSTEKGQVRIGLYYCCSCAYGQHNHALEWDDDMTIEGNRITANGRGKFGNIPHNHSVVEGYQALQPRPARIETPLTPLSVTGLIRPKELLKDKKSNEVVYEPKPAPKPAPQGQIQLF